ncbi:IS1634 family transposase [Candidatus Woesearchaeota archaeon]|nr:IS1634 family transposase [Candidatus Woesearchaeota archaeon]
MVSLKKKKIKGQIYWYAVEMARVNGKPTQIWQKYLGTAEKIIELKEKAAELSHIKLKSFQYGKTAALLSISNELNFIETVNKHTNKKKIEGLTVGEYLLLNIIGRCDGALSENAMQQWFDKSSLNILWKFPHKLTCQNFLNHYKYIDLETSKKIEDDLCRILIEKGLTPQILFLDETNWFTYINKGQELPQNGKNKQYRNHMKQVCMGLAVSEDNVPFMHEVYEGNKHDAKIFPNLLGTVTKRLSNLGITTENMILVFDKGNNSQVNIQDALSKMHIVASAKHNQAEELLYILLNNYKYLYTNTQGNKIYGYRIKHEFFGKEFTAVVLYNGATCKKQKKSYEESKKKIWEKLEDLKRRLQSNRGKERDKSSVEREVNDIIHKDFRSLFGYEVGEIPQGMKKPTLKIWIENEVEKRLYVGFGKTIVFTDMHAWQSKKIAQTYSQKHLVEDDFKLLNDVLLVPVGPINHHTDFNIRAHIFLCIIGMIFYRYMAWKCKNLRLSLGQLMEELESIRIALVQEKLGGKVEMVVEEMGAKQAKLFSLLYLGEFINN